MIPNHQLCVLCRTIDRDGNLREKNAADPATLTCKGCFERLAGAIAAIPAEWAKLSAAPGSGTGQARVSGSGEQPLGVRIAALDLMSPANTGTVHDEYGDQTGDASIASVLAILVDDWAHYRGKGETGPARTVADLAAWLLNRLDWATCEHPALVDVAHDIYRALGALMSANGNLPDPDDHRDGVECPRCDRMTLYDTGVYIECVESKHGCGKLLTLSEYAQWVQLKGYFLRAAIPCPSCGLTALAGTRAHQRVECVVAKGGCGVVLPWTTYDLWAKAVASVEKAGALLWGERHPLPGPSSYQKAA